MISTSLSSKYHLYIIQQAHQCHVNQWCIHMNPHNTQTLFQHNLTINNNRFTILHVQFWQNSHFTKRKYLSSYLLSNCFGYNWTCYIHLYKKLFFKLREAYKKEKVGNRKFPNLTPFKNFFKLGLPLEHLKIFHSLTSRVKI